MFTRYLSKLFVLVACLILAVPSYGTNGIFLIGYGAKSRSMGGVGIGYTQDAIGNQMNPAGIANIDLQAMRLDFDLMLFRPKRSVVLPDPRVPPNAGNPIRYKSGSDLFAIPAMGMAYKFNRKLYLGFSFVGSGGGNTRYTKQSPLGYNFFNPVGRTGISDNVGMNFAQAQLAITGAYKINKQHTIAVSPVIGIQTFRAYGLGVFQPFSSDPDYLTGNGNDWAYGAGLRLGWQGKLTDWLQVGATYTSKLYFTKFDQYKGLFAEHGSMDTPANVGIGFAINPTKKLTVAFDWQRVMYSDVASINNPIEAISSPSGFLGEDGGAGFGWEDQNIYKIGIKYNINSEWDAMLGWNYGESPIPKGQLLFSALAPAVTENHLTMGAAYRPSSNIEWTLAYVHAFNNREKGKANSGGQFDNFFPNSTLTGPGDMELQMYQDSVEVSFAYKL